MTDVHPYDDALVARAQQIAILLARQAGGILRDLLDAQRTVTHKGMVDLVTDADQASEALIHRGLMEAFPDHRLIGEEGSVGATATIATQSWGWVFDPLDGTTNYAHRYPHFAVSIGLEYNAVPVMGVVYDPMRDELFAARKGHGATLNGVPIHVTDVTDLQQSLLATGFSYNLEDRPLQYAMWETFNSAARGVRRDGAAALNLCWVAAGRLDGYWERPVQAWDMGAAVIIVREAGGLVTALDHEGFDLYTPEALAANPVLHAEIQTRLKAISMGHAQAAPRPL
jgi:myo-inositol-1(or 4)-monophosphatase